MFRDSVGADTARAPFSLVPLPVISGFLNLSFLLPRIAVKHLYLVVSRNTGSPNRPQCIILLAIWTPKKGPLLYGNPHCDLGPASQIGGVALFGFRVWTHVSQRGGRNALRFEVPKPSRLSHFGLPRTLNLNPYINPKPYALISKP